MAKLVITEFVSLDGVMEAPGPDGSTEFAGWTMPYGNEEFQAFKMKEREDAAALLLGRITYDGFAKAWPNMTGDPFGEKMNSMPKYVVSHHDIELPWNNSHLVKGDVASEVAKLKESVTDGDILIDGSGSLVRSLMKDNLIDEYRLMVFPVVLGIGKRLFDDGATAKLKLVSSQALKTGVVILTYAPEA